MTDKTKISLKKIFLYDGEEIGSSDPSFNIFDEKLIGAVKATFSGEEGKQQVSLIRNHWNAAELGYQHKIIDDHTVIFSTPIKANPATPENIRNLLSSLGTRTSYQTDAIKALKVISGDIIEIEM